MREPLPTYHQLQTFAQRAGHWVVGAQVCIARLQLVLYLPANPSPQLPSLPQERRASRQELIRSWLLVAALKPWLSVAALKPLHNPRTLHQIWMAPVTLELSGCARGQCA